MECTYWVRRWKSITKLCRAVIPSSWTVASPATCIYSSSSTLSEWLVLKLMLIFTRFISIHYHLFYFKYQILRAGGCGYKVLMLLEGAGHLYLFPSAGAKRWDTCAPEAVLTAAGGALTDLRGNHYDYRGIGDPMDRGGIMATPVADWIRVYTPLMPKEVLDSLTFF